MECREQRMGGGRGRENNEIPRNGHGKLWSRSTDQSSRNDMHSVRMRARSLALHSRIHSVSINNFYVKWIAFISLHISFLSIELSATKFMMCRFVRYWYSTDAFSLSCVCLCVCYTLFALPHSLSHLSSRRAFQSLNKMCAFCISSFLCHTFRFN